MKLLRFTILAVCLMMTAHVLAQSDLRCELLSYEKSDSTAEVSITIEWARQRRQSGAHRQHPRVYQRGQRGCYYGP